MSQINTQIDSATTNKIIYIQQQTNQTLSEVLQNAIENYYQKLREIDESLITTWCVVTETCYLLLKRKGVLAQSKFMESLANGAFETFNLQSYHAQKIAQLMTKYSNLPMDLADASLVILAEELGHGRILSIDYRDFNTYRWKNTQPFQNLLQ